MKYRELHLIRHAKSSWSNPSLADIDRPLNTRGKKACLTMAEHIEKEGGLHKTTSILCSPAVRAQQTIKRILKASNMQRDWMTLASLYTFNLQELLQTCQDIKDSESSITLIGHNPAIHELVEYLTGEHIIKLPTCSYIKLECAVNEWNELTQKSAKLACFIYPKMFS